MGRAPKLNVVGGNVFEAPRPPAPERPFFEKGAAPVPDRGSAPAERLLNFAVRPPDQDTSA